MNEPPRETPSVERIHRSPRSDAIGNILFMAEELLVARFALARCMDKLDLVQLLDVFSEVAETLERRDGAHPMRLITPRDQNR